MSNETLPKFMFLQEDSEQMRDKRIQTIQSYKETGDGEVERIREKRINNTIPTEHQPYSQGIFNIEYSNKYGVLLQATENYVLVFQQQEFQNHLLKGKQETQTSQRIQFAGQIFLSPSEDILAACSESLIQLFHMETIPQITSPPIANRHQSHRFLWVTESKLLLWSFEGQAYLLEIDQKTLNQVALNKIKEINYCTGASIVGDSLLIFQKLEVFIFQLGKIAPLKCVDMSWGDHNWIYYDFSYIVEIFRVNVHESPLNLNTRMKVPFGKEDILGLVLIYYDQDGEDQHQRCLTFFRGNLLEGGKDLRGQQNFYVAQNKPEYYMDDDEKLSFGVKVSYVGCFICIMLQRSYIVYIIDPFEKFDRINIYSPNGKLQLKDPQSKFFRGMAILKNMLPYEKKIPQKGENTLLERIVKDFDGQFMMLYFADQETNLTIPFPASVLALTQDTLYRRFAVSSLGGIDKDKDEEIIEEMKSIKRSPYLIEPSKKININARQAEVKKEQKSAEAKQQKKKNIGIFGSKKQDQKKQEPPKKKQEPSSLQTEPISKNSLFGKPGGENLFGNSSEPKLIDKKTNPFASPSNLSKPSQSSKPNSKLFTPQQGNSSKTSAISSLFAANPTTAQSGSSSSGNIFGNSVPPGGSLFGQSSSTSAFGKNNPPSLFGKPLEEQKKKDGTKETSLDLKDKAIISKNPVEQEDPSAKVVAMFDKMKNNTKVDVKQAANPVGTSNIEQKTNSPNLFNTNQSSTSVPFKNSAESVVNMFNKQKLDKQTDKIQGLKEIPPAAKIIDDKSSSKGADDFSTLFKQNNEKKHIFQSLGEKGEKKFPQINNKNSVFGNSFPQKTSRKYDFNINKTETQQNQKPTIIQQKLNDNSKIKLSIKQNTLQDGANKTNSQKIEKPKVIKSEDETKLFTIKEQKLVDSKLKEKQQISINKKQEEASLSNNNYTDLTSNLLVKIQQLKKQIKKFSSTDSSKNTRFKLDSLKKFNGQQVEYLQNPQKLYLGTPLVNLLQKSEHARKSYEYYQSVLEAALKNSFDRQEITSQLSRLDQLLEIIIYFQKKFVAKRDIKDKSANDRKKCEDLLDLFDRKFIDLKQQANNIVNEIGRVLQEKKKQRQKDMRKMSSRNSKRVFNFNEFAPDEDKKESSVRQKFSFNEFNESQVKVSQSYMRKSKIYSAKRQPGQFHPVYVRLSEITGNPQYILKQFQMKQAGRGKSQGKLQQKKLPSSQSFIKINETKNSDRQTPKQKIEIPKVNVKMFEIKQNQAVSQPLQKSDSQSEDYPLPATNRQISKIDQPLFNASKKSINVEQPKGKGEAMNIKGPGIFGKKQEINQKQKLPLVLDQNKQLFGSSSAGVKQNSLFSGNLIKNDKKIEGVAKDDKKIIENSEMLGKKQKLSQQLPKISTQTNSLSSSLFSTQKQIPSDSTALPGETMKASLFGGLKPAQPAAPLGTLFGASKPVEPKGIEKQTNSDNNQPTQALKAVTKEAQLNNKTKADNVQKDPKQVNSLFSFASSNQNNLPLFTSQKAPQSVNKQTNLIKPDGAKKQGALIGSKQGDKPASLFGSSLTALNKPGLGQVINKGQKPSISPSSQPNPTRPVPQQAQIKNVLNKLSDAQVQKQTSDPKLVFTDNKPPTIVSTNSAANPQKNQSNLFLSNSNQAKIQNLQQQQGSKLPQPQQSNVNTGSTTGSLFSGQGAIKPTFGGVSKLMGQQGQASGAFDPNAMSFGAGTGLKSFTSVAPNQNNTLFSSQSNQNNVSAVQQNQSIQNNINSNQAINQQNTVFGQQPNQTFNQTMFNQNSNTAQSTNLFGNISNNNSFSGSNSNNFNFSNNNNGMFGNSGAPQSANFFNQGSNNTNSNFLQNLSSPSPMPPPSNPSLMAMRK